MRGIARTRVRARPDRGGFARRCLLTCVITRASVDIALFQGLEERAAMEKLFEELDSLLARLARDFWAMRASAVDEASNGTAALPHSLERSLDGYRIGGEASGLSRSSEIDRGPTLAAPVSPRDMACGAALEARGVKCVASEVHGPLAVVRRSRDTPRVSHASGMLVPCQMTVQSPRSRKTDATSAR